MYLCLHLRYSLLIYMTIISDAGVRWEGNESLSYELMQRENNGTRT
jgi:hypothetical protein